MKKHAAIVAAFFLLVVSVAAFALTNEEERTYGKEIYLEIAQIGRASCWEIVCQYV
jgi:hypothetical protein